jgi:adenine-specific DNA-methyltransferase
MEFLSKSKGIVPWTWWPHEEAGHTGESKKEANTLFGGDVSFDTPKPERLIQRILQIATNEDDLVLDSFVGSGTTAAVAHKMGRRYIGIEMGDHAMTHCVPRLQKVIEGEEGGISKSEDWHGGGGFRFYNLGVPVFDENGHISTGIRFAPLAAHLWFVSTGIPYKGHATSPFLGEHEGIGFYLLYNGILGDQSADGGNVLTGRILGSLPNHDGQKVIFGESCRLSTERLQTEHIIFRQIPYEIKAR